MSGPVLQSVFLAVIDHSAHLKVALVGAKVGGAGDELDHIFFLKSENVESAGHFDRFKSVFVSELRQSHFQGKTPIGDEMTISSNNT